ncbi:S-layer homology domain-containing protein [Sporosarcina sp. 179-K 3D1 HS]|uniref:S-layer homology domain-containing protein n=1 Tax=Sporosarcina sp. 179-K 3D1 HS TaxID=3232169 RepID=UPI00399F7538
MKKCAILAFGLFALLMTMSDVQAASWQEGEVITGAFMEKKVDTYTITIEEDARVTFTLKDNEDEHEYSFLTDYNVMLYDSMEQRIASISTYRADDDQDKTVLPVNLKKGTYQVKVAGTGIDSQGDYAVSYKTGPIEGNDLESNNEKSTATPYNLGETYQGDLNGSVFSNDYDLYKVEIPTFGKVKVQLQKTEGTSVGNAHFDMTIVDEKDVNRFSLTSFYGNPNDIEVLLQPGTYYFNIRLANSRQAIAKYTFTTNFVPLNEQDWESGRNTSIARADVLENNKTYNGFWYSSPYGHSQTHDYYKYTLAKDAKVTYIADSPGTKGELTFLDENGVQLPYLGYANSDTSKIITTKELKAGTYYLIYYSRHGGRKGYEGYNLTLRIQSFSDVPMTHLYYEPIEVLAQLGINKGYPDGTFHPHEAIQRKHVFALLNRIEGLTLPKIRTMKTFKDVTAKHPNYPEMKAFYEAGIIDGHGSYMNPGSNLTRAQLAKILVNTFDLKMNGAGINFSDVNSSNSFYEYIQILASNGITIGSNGKYMPNDPVTRQHFSVFLQRTLELNS